jgi:Uri superfamily endonuclease
MSSALNPNPQGAIPASRSLASTPGSAIRSITSWSSLKGFPLGKLGNLQLQSGFYVYIGSAHGPGGLRARLAHHLGPSAHPHWHIDYLKAHVTPEEVWYCYDRTSWEHPWAHCLDLQRNASVPLAGFGSSDCACESHLFSFRTRPSRTTFARRLGVFDRGHPPVQLHKLKRII